MKRIALFSLLSAVAAHAAIKKDEGPLPTPQENPPAKPATPPKAEPAKPKVKDADSLMEELRKRTQKNGKVEPGDMEEMFRDLLEMQGVPKSELKGMNLLDLMKKLQEKNPEGIPGLKFGPPGGAAPGNMFGFGSTPEQEKKLNDHFKGLLEGHKPGTLKAAPATFVLRDAAKKEAAPGKGEPKPLFGNLADLFLNSTKNDPAGPLALATGVNADGWILTKASEVKKAKELQCQVKGAWVSAKVIRVWEDDDLALVKVATKDLPTVHWSSKVIPDLGSFLSAVAPEGLDPVAIGVVSVPLRNQKMKGRGYLGVQLDTDDHGLRIKSVIPDAAAFIAGVLANDRILELDGQKPDSYNAFTRIVGDRKPGEKVKLKLQRGDDVMEKEIKLGDRPLGPRPFDNANNFGSVLSQRRDEFPAVVQTDFPMNANQCGGPVTDLDGNVLGLVIARSGRVETLFLPSDVIKKHLAEVDFAKETEAAAKADVPKADAPKVDPPKPEAPKTSPAKTESAPKTEAPKAEPVAKPETAPKAEAPKTEPKPKTESAPKAEPAVK
jgi:serine protease Do